MNAECRQVLIYHVIPSRNCTIGKGFIFQLENNLKYTTIAVKSYFERKTADKTLTVVDWPPQSPDLNIREGVWDKLDRKRNKRQLKSKVDLWEVLKEVWYNIPEEHFRKLLPPQEFNMCLVPREVTLNTDF